MPYYSVPGSQATVTSGYKTGAQAQASATPTRRGKITEFYFGAISNPNSTTDCAVQVDLSRMTATGAGAATAWTPNPMDPADGAAQSTAYINATAEATTITANSSLWNNGLNQRNSIRVMLPQESQYIVWPTTSASGIVSRVTSGTFTTSYACGFTYME
jgi:hypothetical protein